jgi:hypothetical protein
MSHEVQGKSKATYYSDSEGTRIVCGCGYGENYELYLSFINGYDDIICPQCQTEYTTQLETIVHVYAGKHYDAQVY